MKKESGSTKSVIDLLSLFNDKCNYFDEIRCFLFKYCGETFNDQLDKHIENQKKVKGLIFVNDKNIDNIKPDLLEIIESYNQSIAFFITYIINNRYQHVFAEYCLKNNPLKFSFKVTDYGTVFKN